MEIKNDKILKFSGRSPNNIYDFDNIYSPDGIGIQLISSNTQLSFIDTNNNSKLNINLNNSNINLINSNGSLNFNNLSINNSGFVGINSTIPQSSLDVSGRITCLDINLSNSIITSNFINKLGTSINDINSGILSSNCGGTNKSSFQNGQIIFGNNQSQFLNWNDDLKRVGIGMTNAQHSLDINGNINGLFFRTYGRFINEGFSTKDDVSRSSNSSYFNSSNNSYKNSYNYITIFKNELNDKIIDYEIWKKYSYGRYYTNLKVGIGNANPTYNLSISGDLNYTGNLRRYGKNIRTFNGDFNDLYNSVGVCWNLTNENIYKANTGSVGIGKTTIPLTSLDINGGINFRSNIKKNGNIMKFFNGDYNNLNNLPNLSLFAYSGSFYHLKETPNFFNGDYYSLIDIPTSFNVDWNKTISNLPTHFKTDWNSTIDNIPITFNVDWNSNIFRKPINFPTDWDTTIANKPEIFQADWCNSISNRPLLFDTDWKSNILNKPNFSKLAYTGEYNDVLNKPYIFSGDYNDLSNKPKYAEVCFTGNYYDLCNQPRLFNGDYNYLSNIPTYFKTNWNSTIINLPDFKKVAFTASYNDLIDEPIDNWGENGTHIFSCNSINIGIGNSNPLYNLDITSNFSIEGSFKIVFNNIIVNNPPWAYYLPENWNNSSILLDSSGNNNHATTSGSISKISASGNGATSIITYLSGDTSSSISFPIGSISSNYTILSLTRYTGDNRGRILQSQTGNWLHGHWSGRRGVCHYEGWKTSYENSGNRDDWLCCIGKNSSSIPNNILLDGIPSGIASGGGNNYQLGINLGISEFSDWGFGCLFIWDKHLNDDDMIKLSDIIKNYLNFNGSLNNYIKNIFVYNESYFSNSLNINNQNFSNAFGVISEYNKTANWLNSGINAYNRNNGNIGIGTIEPFASYKLDVRGVINTDSNFNLSSSGAIFWSSYGTTGIGCAGIDNQYSTSSLTGDLVIRSQTTKKIILQNGSNNSFFFINSGNIGIGISSPTSLLHIHNSNSNMEMKILLTDGSTGISSTNGFSLFKNSNGIANIWNYVNRHLRFGTNDIDRMFIKNDGFIGIGTTNPLSICHLHNSNSNGEVKLSLNSFSIYKDGINDDGFIWNNSNNSLRFGTNNFENMLILNNGNIGIGINTPSSLLHLHNSNSNGEIRLILTDGNTGTASNNGFLIYKDVNEDAYIWNNTNNSVRIGIFQTSLSYTMSDFLSPWAFYSAENFSGTTLNDTSGNNNHATSSGTITKSSASGNGSINSINFISGGTTATLSFPSGSIPSTFTILSFTRYTGGTRKRILQSQSGNWLHGHYNGNRGVCHYDAWKTGSTNIGNVDDWLCCIGKNSSTTPNNILIDGVPSGTASGGASGYRLGINLGVAEYSDWALSYVIIWDKHLTDNEMIKMNNYFNIIRGIEKLTISSSGNIGIGINNPSSLFHLHNSNSNGEVKLILTDGNTGTASNNGLSIYKDVNEDAYIWNNTNNPIKIGTFQTTPSMTNFYSPWAFYSAENFSNNILSDTSGNNRHATTSGIITKSSASGNGSLNSINFISGGTSATISFPSGSIPLTFTILSLTRYIGGTRKTILQSQSRSWIHGHWNGNRGVCYYDVWKTGSTNIGNVDDWLCCIGKNSSTTPNNILIDGIPSGVDSGGNGGSVYQLAVNIGHNPQSDWALAYVIIWDKHLTYEEMIIMNNYFNIIRGIEKLTISSSGNIGIGINNPSSLLHLHKSNSNEEIKILLTDGNTGTASNNGLSIYKDINKDGFIWNYTNNSLRFGISKSIPSYSMTDFLNPWAFYSAENFSGSNLNDTSGNNRHAITTGTITKSFASGNGSLNSINFISGGVDSYITFPDGSIPANFTILSLTKYNGGNRRKILTAKKSSDTDNTEWYHGHNSGLKGLCYYNSWITSSSGISENLDDWVCVIGKNGGSIPNNIIINGISSGTNTGGIGNRQLGINYPNNDWTITSGYWHYPYGSDVNWSWYRFWVEGETKFFNETRSDWALSYIIIWDKHLTFEEMFKMNNYINNIIGNENLTILASGNIGVGINNPSSLLHLHNSNGDVKLLLTDGNTGTASNNGLSIYKSSNEDGFIWNYPNFNLRFGTSNLVRMSILNNGNIGINTISPSYLLDINGTLNGYYLRGDGSSITNLSFSKISTGILTIGLTGTGKNTLEVNQILFGNNTLPLGQSSNLFWDNGNSRLGINKTNPSTSLDVLGTITATNFSGIGSNITNLNTCNLSSGSLPVGNGGTTKSIYTSGQILFGNSNSNINSSSNLFWDNINSRLGINKTNPLSNLDVNGTITGTFSGNGSNITNLNATNFSLGTLGNNKGGTGTSTFSSGQILIANDTSAIYTSINLFWDNTSNRLGINKTNPSTELDVNGTITGTFSGNGSNITNLNISNFSSGTLGINRGGIGNINLSNGRILFGNTTTTLNNSINLFWDNTSNRLGIGSTIPKYSLETIGDINFTGDLKKNGISYTGDQGVWTSSGTNIYFNSGNIEIGEEYITSSEILNVKNTLKCNKFVSSNGFATVINNNINFYYISSYAGNDIPLNDNTSIIFQINSTTSNYIKYYGLYGNHYLNFYVKNDSTITNNGFYLDTNKVYMYNQYPFYTIVNQYDYGRLIVGIAYGDYSILISSANLSFNIFTNTFQLSPYAFTYSNVYSSNWKYVSGGTYRSEYKISSGASAIFEGSITVDTYIIVISDIRIKNAIKDINSSYAIDIINKIKPKSFKYINYIENGYNDNYGFIAQEIKELLPEAISLKKEYVPNVFKLFDINKDIIQTDEDLTSLLSINDEIQIIDKTKKMDCKILEITSSYIKIDKSIEDDKIFIYGKKVDDFHILNKEYIFTLNVSATQELHKKLEIQEKRIQELDKLLEEEDRKLREQEEKIEFLLNNFF